MWTVRLSADALRQFRKLPASARKLLKTALTERLEKQDPTHADRNRFPLRRPSPSAAYELRVESWRVFYQVVDADEEVQITLIGRKEGNRLIVEGEEFEV
ncbi:MAG: type II toxin-antitoxin system RelE/ParE family toxin [Deltaproteobacteria bacterium]|nr:type II toxin-antitoxin system RelE/ParE family toxin [Deltaproteobacteria bacterium]